MFNYVETFAQHSKLDSLSLLVKKDKEDTNKVYHLILLSDQYQKRGDKDSSEYCYITAQQILDKLFPSEEQKNNIVYLRNSAFVMNGRGINYKNQGDYLKSLEEYFKSMKLNERLMELNQKEGKAGLAKNYGNIGIVYKEQGDFPNALEYSLKALKLDEELGDKKGMAMRLGNIGIVYKEQADYPKALDYYFKALKIDEELGNKAGVARHLGNIGVVYINQNDYKNALDYCNKALKIDEALGSKSGIARNLSNIGTIYKEQSGDTKFNSIEQKKFLDLALEIFLTALKMTEELGTKNGTAIQLSNIGGVYTRQMKYKEAFDYLYRALALAKSIDAMDKVKENYGELSTLYEKSNISLPDSVGGKLLNMEQMRLRSLHYYKRFIDIRDTLFSEENKKQLVRKEMNFDFEKKEAATKAEQDIKDALAKEELKQKEKQRNYFILGFALVGLLSLFIFRSYRQKQKANKIISLQKILVEEKQKEILDSIHYAKRIQQSLLPTDTYIDRTLKRLGKS